ncbi:hypothetical protein EMIHUDRAFT_223479 [Emiliania huxleyi CCMP1516]|uniref:Uncharacterized protein n=2 Tax=Emiliania huxleyi TaxID=2903 RepID=A0A0D3KU85_EMIH1|nr:hypothetical protein EMIHUDRAFT_223479 [Emiliania huxleyi CCMP1516]EOD39320.1 hypothetical protein EMIHUDRAFT_223479 [Emiliania huxleyi CCMP1516]|eukprot:XP_005791749.1 hypothetical protein EMIHUDRAFT_223479 [Emiliania huxleyi CCMP1516]
MLLVRLDVDIALALLARSPHRVPGGGLTVLLLLPAAVAVDVVDGYERLTGWAASDVGARGEAQAMVYTEAALLLLCGLKLLLKLRLALALWRVRALGRPAALDGGEVRRLGCTERVLFAACVLSLAAALGALDASLLPSSRTLGSLGQPRDEGGAAAQGGNATLAALAGSALPANASLLGAPTLADLPTLAPMVAAGAPLLAVASAAVLRRGPLQATPLEAFLGMLAGGKGEEEWSEVGVGTALSSWFLSLQVPLLLLVAAAAVALIHKRLSGAASADAKPAPRAPRPQSRAVARGANGGVGSGARRLCSRDAPPRDTRGLQHACLGSEP